MSRPQSLVQFSDEPPVQITADDELASVDGARKWKVMIIDDDEDVHNVTHLVLSSYRFNGDSIEIIDGYSGKDAIDLMTKHPDTAVLILDIIMETDDAGLKSAKYIREELNNPYVRIILRTGQPGQTPERDAIEKYNINDYKDKSELSSQKLYTALTSALRAYDDIKKIEALAKSNEALEKAVKERTQELLQVNRNLKDNKAQLAQAQEIANMGSWSMELLSNEINCSNQVFKILGIEKSEKPLTLQWLLNFIPAKDRFWVELAIKDAKKNGTYNVEHTLKHKNKLRYIKQEGVVLFDDKGKPYRLMCVIHDITEFHDAEKKSLQLANALEQISDAVIITNSIGTIEFVNKAFSDMTGYKKAELIGKIEALKRDKSYDAFYKNVKAINNSNNRKSDVAINRRKDGTRYFEERTTTPLKDESGNIINYITSCTDVTESIKAQEKLQYLAQHDPLTSLPNRNLFQDRLEQNIARSPWHDRLVALVFIDLDGFKKINDELGHDVGDKLLQSVAQRLSACIRDGDTAARLGGDEFAVILDDIAQKKDIEIIVNKIQDSLAEPTLIEGHIIATSSSIGISLCPDDGQDNKKLLKKADMAMYKVKSTGKNSFQFYFDEEQ